MGKAETKEKQSEDDFQLMIDAYDRYESACIKAKKEPISLDEFCDQWEKGNRITADDEPAPAPPEEPREPEKTQAEEDLEADQRKKSIPDEWTQKNEYRKYRDKMNREGQADKTLSFEEFSKEQGWR